MPLSPSVPLARECICGDPVSAHVDGKCHVRHYREDGAEVDGFGDRYDPCDCPGLELMPCGECGGEGCDECEDD